MSAPRLMRVRAACAQCHPWSGERVRCATIERQVGQRRTTPDELEMLWSELRHPTVDTQGAKGSLVQHGC